MTDVRRTAPITPQRYLNSWLEKDGHSKAWLCREMGISLTTLKRILNGGRITERNAIALERVTHLIAETWLNMQTTYMLWELRYGTGDRAIVSMEAFAYKDVQTNGRRFLLATSR